MSKLKISLLGFLMIFFLVPLVFGQEATTTSEATTTPNVSDEISLDETVQANDLGMNEPNLLPDNPFYFLKNWSRSVRLFFTFNPVRKLELKSKFSNERLLEARKMIRKNKDPEKIKKAIEKYQESLDKIKDISQKIKEKAEENPRLNKFLDKWTQQQVLHQKILQKLEEKVPPEVLKRIKEARERHLKRFGEVMTRLENKNKIAERLNKNIERIRGSKYKDFKNLEILKNLEEKVPEEAREAIRKARENSLERLKEKLEKMSPEDQERFNRYIERIGGEREKHMEILENLRLRLREATGTAPVIRLRNKLNSTSSSLSPTIREQNKNQ